MIQDVIPTTQWSDSQGNKFLVLGVFDKEDGSTWVYYREDKGPFSSIIECESYSCLVESFCQRFRLLKRVRNS